MSINPLYIIILTILVSSCSNEISVSPYSNDKDDISSVNLLNVEQAYEIFSNKSGKYKFIQVSKESQFSKSHIPGALQIWRPDYAESGDQLYSGLRAPKEKLEVLLQTLGIQASDTLIIYDAKANVDALRFIWLLELYQFNQYYIFNGGLQYWEEKNYPTDTASFTKPIRSNIRLSKESNEAGLARFEDMLDLIDDKETIIIDTREPYEYEGKPFIKDGKMYTHKNGAFTHGCIPNAKHLNWSTLCDLDGDHRFKSMQDIRYDLNQLGITGDKNIIVYCHSGSRSSHTYFVLKHILGFEKVKNYDGSWIEWSYKHKQNREVLIEQRTDEIKRQQLIKALKNKVEGE